MKKLIYTIGISLGIIAYSFGQNATDALRYSQNFIGGTARSVSMAGAFGALGGDMISLSYNPAGIGVYRKSEFVFSPTINYSLNNASYLENAYSDFKYNLNFNNVGLIGAFTSDRDEGWVSTNVGVVYNKLNDFNQNILIEGENTSNSITDYFARLAKGKNSTTFSYFNEGLAWDAYLINPVDSLTNTYESVLNKYGETQRKIIKTEGGINELAFSLGANFSHKIYVGATLGIQSVNYEENSIYSEEDLNYDIDSFASMTYNQHLLTTGAGFNLKIGTIFRPIDWIRVGIAVHTPTFYNLKDEYESNITALYDFGAEYEVNSPKGSFDYELSTPLKAIGSMAFVIKQSGLISFDYEFVDYTTARLRSDDYSFFDENMDVQDNLVAVSNIRAGAEYRFGPYSFRGGYALYGNPYNKNSTNNKVTYSSFSGGFGIKDEVFFFDLAYVLTKSKTNYFMYDPSVITNDPASITNLKHKIIATFGFKF
ncbi:MAG TPA: hypothetical protein DDX39_08110 [Bacteroidales bacterium]|nr:MAG: hypothetical protein A2W98_14845 [Bacteroidetes bacterium GWF2_33_38]OFY91329.1 MAG: hypothetical protein A2236_13750 [Bacteroidetes bacterium RIFOXYA2_FULL_33_7]HBF88591.1 hypothetical protein [Bacteroidales bacterium]